MRTAVMFSSNTLECILLVDTQHIVTILFVCFLEMEPVDLQSYSVPCYLEVVTTHPLTHVHTHIHIHV